MARQNINIGSSANDGTGDPLRTAFDKINDNFVELYGADNDINTLDANMDVNNYAITTGVTNGDVTITPNGTGNINLGSITINGSTISANDSTQITLAENIQTTGTLNVSGAATLATSLTLASGATVTSILDEDAMGSDSATALATQQSIKAYVDSQVTAQDLDFQGDSGGALAVDLDSQTFTIAGGTGIDTAGSGQTLTVNIDSTVATLTGTQTLSGKTLTAPTINAATMTGTVTIDSLSFADNTITTNASNANLELTASGTGTVELLSNTNVTGTLTTADITTTGTHTVTGQSDIDYVRIKDNKITTNATNANLELAASGTGVVDVKTAMTTVGQTITGNVVIDGQFDIDNISISGNGIIATNSGGGININPNASGQVTIGGTVVQVPGLLAATDINVTSNVLLGADCLITTNVSNADINIDANGTGSVYIDELRFRDNNITTHVTNANLELTTDGTGTIELQTNTNVTGNLSVTGSSTLDGVTITDNTIKANASNADLQIGTSGTGVIDILTATQTTVGSAGGANALPATPTGYIKIKIAGTMRVIPFYDEA
jgi:fibronectin-binding autotransporter adhesin